MSDGILVVGHRGWPARYPDNTLAGLLAASTVADIVEIDVRRASDGKLLLSHDAAIGGHVVATTPWSILAETDLGGGHKPALLDEVLAALPDTPVHIEVKNRPGDTGYEPDHRLALEAAERARAGDVIASFNPDTLEKVRKLYPEVETGLAVMYAEDVDGLVRYCLQAGHGLFAPLHLMVDPHLLELVGGAMKIFPWTVNEPDRAAELARLGVAGIITDRPDEIREAVRGTS